jgi:hypothetical protein
MATFASFFNNTTITSQERDLFTELMGERNLVADDNLDGSKRKRKKPSAGRRRGRPHRKATVKVQKGSQKNAHGKSRVSKEAASAELPAWSIDDYEELSEALHLVSMDQSSWTGSSYKDRELINRLGL